ncbi:hypothetical protein HIM_12569 [Hirsutella minnesotensis 3608]|uniref:DUF6570 domain-containing protein n=1 Tax=Hirsutella minnesotensis 3608 TaxID=1043627 RepID=A0A0F7ZVY7_9HYPO|nr:hypothetical protein HIM_12569 [Hirsutella minnesotensis 3608]
MTIMRFRREDGSQHLPRPIRPKGMENAGGVRSSGRLPRLSAWPPRPATTGEQDRPRRDEAARALQPAERRKRIGQSDREEPLAKRVRRGHPRQKRTELQAEELASVLHYLEEEFAVKERMSNEQTCRLGCEHMFPDELKGLTPVEEKLISLNSPYGFVARCSIPGGQRQAVRYPRHVKGHITVFPNNVQELATKVLQHPLLQVMDEIHVSWQGAEKPAPSDLSGLLSRNEPSAWEKTRTAQVVPPAERAMDEDDPAEIEEVLAQLYQGQDVSDSQRRECEGNRGCEANSGSDAEPEGGGEMINEISSSGMFALDGQPDVSDAEKLRFACHAVGGDGAEKDRQGPRTWIGSAEDDKGVWLHVSRTSAFVVAMNSLTRSTPPSSPRPFPPYCRSGVVGHGSRRKPS